MSVDALSSQIQAAVTPLHPHPEKLATDPDLRAALLPLFGDLSPEQIWTDHIEPFLRAREAELSNLYREHGEAPFLASADAIEFPIVLERAENASLALEAAWPLDSIELLRISDAWGVPVSVSSD